MMAAHAERTLEQRDGALSQPAASANGNTASVSFVCRARYLSQNYPRPWVMFRTRSHIRQQCVRVVGRLLSRA